MAEFSGKIVDAYYVNPGHTLVKILYDNGDGDGDQKFLTPYHIEPNDKDIIWQAFLAEGWDEEKLLTRTAEFKRVQSKAYNLQVQEAAKVLAQEMVGMKVIQEEKEKLLGQVESTKKKVESTKKTLLDLDKTAKIRSKTVDGELYDYLLNENENKEELFKAKLWALELETVKESDKDIKSSIRKATRITQVLSIVDKLI